MDINPGDLPLLVSLNALIEECNVTRAAGRLHLSQPAMSAQLARLRTLFDDALLVPSESGRGMVPTPRALALADPLREALRQIKEVVETPAAFDPLRAERMFHVAANDNAIIMVGLEMVKRMDQSGGPGLRLAFHEPTTDQIVGQMERGEIDLLLATTRAIPGALKAVPLCTERYVMAQRKAHPRGRAELTLDGYCAQSHVLVSGKGDFSSFIDTQLAQSGHRRRVAVSIPHYSLVPGLLACTDLVCTLPIRFLNRFADQLDLFPLPFDLPTFAISMAWHARSGKDPALIWLRSQISALSAQTLN